MRHPTHHTNIDHNASPYQSIIHTMRDGASNTATGNRAKPTDSHTPLHATLTRVRCEYCDQHVMTHLTLPFDFDKHFDCKATERRHQVPHYILPIRWHQCCYHQHYSSNVRTIIIPSSACHVTRVDIACTLICSIRLNWLYHFDVVRYNQCITILCIDH